MSKVVNICQDKLNEGITFGSIYIQCPCCFQSYDHTVLLDDLMEMIANGEELYSVCDECGDSFYLCLGG